MPKEFPKLPETWDIQDRCKVEQPDMTKVPLVKHSSQVSMSKTELALTTMRPEALERFARAMYTAESILIWREKAKEDGI